ncbi:MAG TPA: YetF domain-containing protein [Acidimicrobiales bacterium]
MEIVVRATVVFWVLWLIIRGTGKRQLAELTPFDLILFFVMGDLAQQGVTQEDMSLTGATIAVGTVAMWALIASASSYRWSKARRLLDGVPLVVLRDGEPLPEMMKLDRVHLDDLNEAARNQGIDDLAEVELALLEPDGRFSFLKRKADPDADQQDVERHKG